MGSVAGDDCDDVYSVIGDKGEIGFLDFKDDKSVCGFDPIDEGPIVISSPFPFVGGKPQSAPIGETTVDSITIRNSTSDPVELWGIRIFDSNPKDTYALSLMEPPSATADEETIRSFLGTSSLEDRVLQPNQTLTVWLSCKPNDIGLHTSVVHFDVGDDKVERVVFLLAEDKVSQSLASNKPYSRVPRRRQFASDKYVAGSRPLRKGTQGFKYRLPQYAIPANVRELIANKQVPEVLLEGLTRENYASFFSTLLIMEELHMEDDMRGHDMENVTMRRRGNRFLSLEVSGLAERRPSLVYGDYIFAVPATNSDNTTQRYQGFIHRIEADEVFLEFAKEFHQRHSDGNIYNVSFTYNRVNMRRLYQAIQAAQDLGNELLFPSQSSRRSITTYSIVPYNQSINQEQKTAVEMIVNCKGSPPYVIHGPPGTGKTLTIVEAILQLYTTIKSARVLVCAASNSAADHVLEKLINMEIVNIKETEIFRLNASSRPYEDVRQDHIRFCFFEDSIFKCPPLKALLRYKIIISTYMSTSLLYADGIRRGHFSHIFLDEAGQASEPETMIPLANLCQRETVVVLAGDPMQLGPVIYSTDAESFGLGKSYMGRLFECQLYDDEDENFVIKLVRNYRCHPAILELPSKLFYKGELIACKEDRDSTICEWLDLPNKSFPVHFVGVQGCDEREGSNPSWFNRIEASKVVDIIKKLTKNPDVSKEDIGVITPYRQQVMKLKKALETFGMLDVKVGSVEQFQGQEREIIIISTVRSTVKHNEFDRTHNLGFLGNEKRFNVAITRAKSLLIIVGNPHIICKDPYWDKLLRHCSDNNSYQGCPLPPPEKLDDYAEEEGSSVQEHNFTKPGTNEVEWGDETGNFNPKFSDEVEWGDETVKFNPKFSDEVEWGDETVKFSAKFSDEVEWGDETVKVPEIPKPVTDEAEWSDGWR